MNRSSSPTTPRWHGAFVVSCLAAFVLLATYRLDRPGLYADEMIFAPAAYRALGECSVDAGVSSHVSRCFPTYLSPPYLGALKAWLHAPILAVFGPSPWSLRLPSILLAALGLAMLYRLLRRSVAPYLALAAVGCLALDPSLVFQAHFDWGPVVLSTLFRILLLGALWRWLDHGRPRDLAWAMAFGVAGLYDKLNFLWVLVAFAGAALAVDGRRMIDHFRAQWRSHAAVLGGAALLFAWFALHKILPALALPVPGADRPFDPVAQWDKLVAVYNDTWSGAFPRLWISEQPRNAPTWPWRMLMLQFAGVAWLASRAPWRQPRLLSRWRRLLFVTVALALMLGQMWGTRQLAGPHHLFSAWPLPTVLLLLEIDLAVLLWREAYGNPERPRPVLLVTVAALALVAASSHAHSELRGLWRGKYGFRSPLDPAIVQLSKSLQRLHDGRVASIDWGLHEPLLTLAAASERQRYVNMVWFFAPSAPPDLAKWQWIRDTYFPKGSGWLVSFAEGREVNAGSRRRLGEIVATWGGCLRLEQTVAGIAGAPVYQIWKYDADSRCSPEQIPAELRGSSP